jgi:hypothetical protein
VGSKEPHDIARAFWDAWVCRYGVPAAVTSDNGPEFETTFTHMLNGLGIHHIHTSVSHPSANGVAERMVKTLKTILNSHLNDNPTHWKASLPTCRKVYMNRTHTCLGVSPNEMLYGFAPHLPLAVRDPLLSSLVVQLGAGITPQEHVETTRQRLQLLDNQTYLRPELLYFVFPGFSEVKSCAEDFISAPCSPAPSRRLLSIMSAYEEAHMSKRMHSPLVIEALVRKHLCSVSTGCAAMSTEAAKILSAMNIRRNCLWAMIMPESHRDMMRPRSRG